MELKQHGRSAKNLKHKSKSKRPVTGAGSSSGSNDSSGLPGDSAAGGDAKSHASHHHHHHVSHRHGRGGSSSSTGAGSSAAANATKGEEAIRELLTSKIAELQVGGDENLETPIDLSGTDVATFALWHHFLSAALCSAYD